MEYKHLYQALLSPRLQHVSGEALASEYTRADVFALVRERDEYLDFAVPVKLFEAMSFGLPVLTLNCTEAARIVERQGLGWVVADVAEAGERLRSLLQNPAEVSAARHRVLDARVEHSWNRRAAQVGVTLLDVRRQDDARTRRPRAR